jgi:hypothetical protein
MARKESSFKHKKFPAAATPKLASDGMGSKHAARRKTHAGKRKANPHRSKKLAGVMI